MDYVLVVTMVIGSVELVKALFDGNYRAAVIVGVSAIVGGLCGFFAVEGVDVPTGIVIGLSASGLVTVAKYTGIPLRVPSK